MKTWKNHRKAINDRLEELGKSKYWLAQQLEEKGVMKPQMLYTYLRGKATTTEKFEAICGVLGLKIAHDGDNTKSGEA
jgi:hypothetical protein